MALCGARDARARCAWLLVRLGASTSAPLRLRSCCSRCRRSRSGRSRSTPTTRGRRCSPSPRWRCFLARPRRAGVRAARRRVRGEGLPRRAPSAGADLRLADARAAALALRGLAAFAAVAALCRRSVPRARAARARGELSRAGRALAAGREPRRLAARRGRPARALRAPRSSHRTGHAISYDLAARCPRRSRVLSSIAQVAGRPRALRGSTLRGARRSAPARRSRSPRRSPAFSRSRGSSRRSTSSGSFRSSLLLEPAAWVLTAAALVLAQVWFFHYSDVFALGGYVVARARARPARARVVRARACSSYSGARRKTRIPSSSNTSCHSGFRRSAGELHRGRERRIAIRVAGLRLVGGDPLSRPRGTGS